MKTITAKEFLHILNEKGMNQKALEIAKNMLAMGLSAEQVAKATQLPLDIIKNLSNS